MSHLYDRSRTTTDWQCPRKRWYQYEFGGKGIVSGNTSLELYMGSCIHDGLAALAQFQSRGDEVDIEAIASAAHTQMLQALLQNSAGLQEEYEFAAEQAALVEGLLRGFYKHVWPRLLDEYPTILFIEEEMEFVHDGLTFMSRPDLIVADRDGTPTYIEYKSTSSKKEGWVNSWNTAVQLHSTIKAVEATKGVKIEKVIVQGLYKGYECLVPETPVLTADLRWVPVGTLKLGDKIAGFEEFPAKHWSGRNKKRQWKTAEVTNTGRSILPCYKVTLEDNTTVVCSENHLWLTTRDGGGSGSGTWTATKDLSKGHRLLKVADVWQDDTSYSAGYLAAAFDSEGCLVHHTDKRHYRNTWLAFTQNRNVVLQEVQNRLREKAFDFITMKHACRSTHDVMVGRRVDVLRLLGQMRPKRLLEKFSFDALGGLSPMGAPLRIVNLELLGPREVVTIGTTTETLIANGIASHNSYGKQNSPFCYAYRRTGNPPFTTDDVRYDYAPGYRRSPTWEMAGGVAAWVDAMPEQMLADQFPQAPPIQVKDDIVANFFSQRSYREHEIILATSMLKEGVEFPEEVLNATFPQRFDQCRPYFGKACSYLPLCHGPERDPLTMGFIYREPHHELEKAQFDEVTSGDNL